MASTAEGKSVILGAVGVVATIALAIGGAAVALMPTSWVTEEFRAPVAEALFSLAGLLLVGLAYWYVRTRIAGFLQRRKEETAREEALAKDEEKALRNRLERSSALRRARQLPRAKVKPSASAPSVRAPAPSQGALSPQWTVATTSLEHSEDGTRAYLKVSNQGPETSFWARLEFSNPGIMFPPSGDISACWEHIERRKASISSGRNGLLWIGRLQPSRGWAPGFESIIPLSGIWNVRYLLNNNEVEEISSQCLAGFALGLPEVEVTITIFSDPEMHDGPMIRRVNFGKVKARLVG